MSDQGPDYVCTQQEYATVATMYDEMGDMVFADHLPAEIVQAINDCRQAMVEWIQLAEDGGVAPDNGNDREPTDEEVNRI